MRVELLFPSKYLSAVDLIEHGGDNVLTIKKLFQDDLQMRDGSKQMKALLEFSNAKKLLVLNKTNAMTIAALYGPETDAWAGKSITVFPDRVSAFGKVVDGVRIRPAVPKNGKVNSAKGREQRIAKGLESVESEPAGEPALVGADREPGTEG